MMRKPKKKKVDFDLNLLPIISVLAVCISLLLLTAVWVHIGVFNVNQALGTEAESTIETSTLWMQMENDGSVELSVKKGETTKARWRVRGLANSRTDIDRVQNFTKKIKLSMPNIQTALVLPAPQSKYQDMIAVMDGLKKHSITDIGISPL